jgi:hypothetical protein
MAHFLLHSTLTRVFLIISLVYTTFGVAPKTESA